MYPKYFILTLLSLIFCTCKSPENDLYEFDPRILQENEFTLSEIADSIIYILFDDSIPLGFSADYVFQDTVIYFRSYDIGILIYDREGRFIRKIGNIGRGPDEYVSYVNFSVDKGTGEIYNLDIGRAIKVYSRDGQFIRSFPLEEFGATSGIEFYDSKIIIFYEIQFENARYEWIAFDTLGGIIRKQGRRGTMFTANVGSEGPTYRFGSRIFYWNNYCDTVFSILPDLLVEPSFIICPGEHRLPKSYFPFNPALQDFFAKFLTINAVFETNRFYVIKYFYEKNTLAFIDKKSKEVFLFYFEYDDSHMLKKCIWNDLDNGPQFFPENYFIEDEKEYLVGKLYPYQIKAHVTSDEFRNSTPKYPEKKKDLETLAANLKETDNPVLVLIRLKK